MLLFYNESIWSTVMIFQALGFGVVKLLRKILRKYKNDFTRVNIIPTILLRCNNKI